MKGIVIGKSEKRDIPDVDRIVKDCFGASR